MTLLSLLSSLPLSAAVSLSSFSPGINPALLPANCARVYTSAIPSCRTNDFPNTSSTGSRCSVACLQGLASVESSIRTACASVDVPETSLVGIFLLGKGIEVLCGVQIARTTVGAPVPTAAAPLLPTSIGAGQSGGLLMDTRSVPDPPARTPVTTATSFETAVRSADPAPVATESPEAGVEEPLETAPPGVGLVDAPPPPSSTGRPTSTRKAESQVGGGGSPFQVEGGAGTLTVGKGAWVVVAVGICASMLLG